MIVAGIHYNFFINLLIRRKICRFNGFLFFAGQNMRARKIGHVSEVSWAWARPIGIGCTICPVLNTRKLSEGYIFYHYSNTRDMFYPCFKKKPS